MVHRTRLIGLPGTGKTTRLLKMLEELLETYNINDIIYSSFSNSAVDEARERVHKKFSIDKNEMPLFKTLHAICLHLLKKQRLIQGKRNATKTHFKDFYNNFYWDYPEFLDDIYVEIASASTYESVDDRLSLELLDRYQHNFFYNLLQHISTKYNIIPLSTKFASITSKLIQELHLPKRFAKLFFSQLIEISNFWEQYKQQNFLFEFHELLQKVIENKILPVAKVLIVDEFQDTSKIQAKIIDMWVHAPTMEKVIVAGDPNQAIYGFNGATPQFLEEFEHEDHILLNKSFRVPQNIIEYAKETLPNKWVQTMISNSGDEGLVEKINLGKIDFHNLLRKHDTVFVLARTSSILREVEWELQYRGILSPVSQDFYKFYLILYEIENKGVLTWKLISFLLEKTRHSHLIPQHLIEMLDNWIAECQQKKAKKVSIHAKQIASMFEIKNEKLAAEFKKYLRNEEKTKFDLFRKEKRTPDNIISNSDNLSLMTIHASKGKEADCVVLINGGTWYETYGELDEDEERRMFFVGITRAKKTLYIANVRSSKIKETRFLPSNSIDYKVKEDMAIELWD